MGKVIAFPLKNIEATSRKTDPAAEPDIRDVLAEMYEDTGIDFLKVITGDEKERKKLYFKEYQEAMHME